MQQANSLHRSRQFMKIMFVLLFTLHLFAYFGALIFPLSRTVGVISNFSLPAAATSVNSLQDDFYRPKYLPVASAEHSQLFWNHFNFITPMIDNEVLFFAAQVLFFAAPAVDPLVSQWRYFLPSLVFFIFTQLSLFSYFIFFCRSRLTFAVLLSSPI
jgi:hypothetical protein